MPADEKTSLFSIELIVDSVRSVVVPCRLPIIAFRLLDLPTVVIRSLSPHQLDSLRQRVQTDTSRMPLQLRELQDHHGNFVFQKGKSCLFKMDFNVLCRHLHSTPLYLMLLDVWSSPAQLLGSTSIRLNAVADELMKCREENGVTSPSASGGRGVFAVFNLMGSRVATVELGYRMYSLGPALATHLQIQRDKSGEATRLNGRTVGDGERIRQGDVQTVSIQTGDEMVSSAVTAHSVADVREDMTRLSTKSRANKTETEHVDHPDSICKDGRTEEGEEVYITNTVCPPPLFYNSEAIDPLLPCHSHTDRTENEDGDTTSDADSEIEEELQEESGETEHWRNIVASEPNNYPLTTTQTKVEQVKMTEGLISPEGSEIATHKDSQSDRQAPGRCHTEFSLLAGLVSEISQLLSNQSIALRPTVQSAHSESSRRGEMKEKDVDLQELASLVYQRLANQHGSRGPRPSPKTLYKKSRKSTADTARQPYVEETNSDHLCPRSSRAHSPPRPYHNLTYFARFPKKPRPIPLARTEIPFSKPRHRHRAAETINKGHVRQDEPLRRRRNVETARVQQDVQEVPEEESRDGRLRGDVHVSECGSGVMSGGSGEQSRMSIEIRLPDVTVGDEMATEELNVTMEEEATLKPAVEAAAISRIDNEETPTLDDRNQSLHIEDLRMNSLSPLDSPQLSEETVANEKPWESDRESDTYSEQFEDESMGEASTTSSQRSQNASHSRRTASSRSSSRGHRRSTSSSRRTASIKSSSRSGRQSTSSSTSSNSFSRARESRDSAMPRVHSMTNLKPIESNLGYTI